MSWVSIKLGDKECLLWEKRMMRMFLRIQLFYKKKRISRKAVSLKSAKVEKGWLLFLRSTKFFKIFHTYSKIDNRKAVETVLSATDEAGAQFVAVRLQIRHGNTCGE